MKKLIICSFFLISVYSYSQVNRYSTYTPSRYEPMSFEELSAVPMALQKKYNENQKYLYQLKKWILELKTQLQGQEYISRLNSEYDDLTKIEDGDLARATKYLQQTENAVREIISDYKVNANKQNYTNSNENSKSSEQYFNEAYENLKSQKYSEAYELSSKSLNINPNNVNSYYVRALSAFYGFRNYELAIKDFDKFIQMTDNPFDAQYLRGNAHYYNEQYVDAIKDYSEFLKSNPENTDVMFSRALAKSELGDRYGAISDYEKIISLEGKVEPKIYKMSTVYNNKAYCLVQLNKFKEALPFVDKALKLDKSEWYIWDTRGEIYLNLGQLDKSISDLTKAIEIEEHDNSYYLRGLAYLKQENKIKGCKDLSKAGELGNAKAYEEISKKCN